MRLVVLLLCAILFLTGCQSHSVISGGYTLRKPPLSFTGAKLYQSNLRFYIVGIPPSGAGISTGYAPASGTTSMVVIPGDKKAGQFMYNINAERMLYDNLRNFSERLITPDSNSKLTIELIEVVGTSPAAGLGLGEALVAAGNFFVPVATGSKLDFPYKVGFKLKLENKIIREKILEGKVSANYKGWYVGRLMSRMKAVQEMDAIVAEEIAYRILEEIYKASEELDL
jgi:hypothetical protein